MALRATPTIAICLTAGIAAGIALARPDADQPNADPAPAAAPAESATGSAAPTVTIEGFAFTGVTAVMPGTEIAVTNLDGAPHTLTADDGSFDTGNLGQDEAGSIVAPATAGTYTYFCAIHPTMTGSFTVG